MDERVCRRHGEIVRREGDRYSWVSFGKFVAMRVGVDSDGGYRVRGGS